MKKKLEGLHVNPNPIVLRFVTRKNRFATLSAPSGVLCTGAQVGVFSSALWHQIEDKICKSAELGVLSCKSHR
jgi:hypothetical protein